MEKLALKLKNNGIPDVTCGILKDTRHESLNEVNRDQTTKEFINSLWTFLFSNRILNFQ